VNESPIDRLLAALDKLNTDAALAMFAPNARLLTVDGRRAEGTDAVRALLTSFLAALRSTAHTITAQWHQDNVWIAEVEADYVLKDALQISALPRVFVLRDGPDGISDLRVYGAHERKLAEHEAASDGIWVGGRWMPPL
jgi:hypothetical protein